MFSVVMQQMQGIFPAHPLPTFSPVVIHTHNTFLLIHHHRIIICNQQPWRADNQTSPWTFSDNRNEIQIREEHPLKEVMVHSLLPSPSKNRANPDTPPFPYPPSPPPPPPPP